MASRSTGNMYSMEYSQDLGRTYKKLSAAWDKKRGSRDSQANVFINTTKNEPILHVAALLNHVLVDLHKNSNIIKELQLIETGMVMLSAEGDSVWIYDMRSSDAMPKTEQDLVRLYWFATNMVKKCFDVDTQNYLMKHNHIAVCFFVWFFTTPNYFYATKEIKQTSRYGIKKVWKPVLLNKQPKVMVEKQTTIKKRGEMHQVNILPKLENEKEQLQTKITNLISSVHSSIVLDYENAYELHSKMSECFDMNSKCYINGSKSKKLQKLYQDYQKVSDKVSRTTKGIQNAEFQKKKERTTHESVERETMATEDFDCGPVEAAQAEAVQAEAVQAEAAPGDDVPDSWEDLV